VKQCLYYLQGLFTPWAHQKVKEGTKKLGEEVQRLKESRVFHDVTITACAVWDAVSATELPPRPLSFVGKQVPNRVDHSFQVLALDEKNIKIQAMCLGIHRDRGA
jgi:hypothetical protein